MRNNLLRAFPHNQIVLLPQSIVYSDVALAQKDAALYAAHPSLTLLARTTESLRQLDTHFGATPHALAPDAALMLGPLQPACQPTVDVVVLLRGDKEADARLAGRREEALRLLRDAGATFIVDDWQHYRPHPDHKAPAGLDRPLAVHRLDLGNRMLCRGRIVISDRMHAMILSLLMDKPFVGFNNANKKLEAYRDTWFAADPRCAPDATRNWFAEGLVEATQKAVDLLPTLRGDQLRPA